MERITENELCALLRTIINAMPSLLIYVDGSCRIEFWNDKAREISTVEIDAARGVEISEVLPFVKPAIAVIQRAIETGQVQRESRVTSFVEGVARVFAITVYPHVTEGSSEARGALILADALQSRESTDNTAPETAGQVPHVEQTNRIAHEINNHLAGILQNIQVIRQRLVGDLPKNRSLAEACGTTLEAIRAYIDKRDIVPMIEAILDSGKQAAKAVTTGLHVDRTDDTNP